MQLPDRTLPDPDDRPIRPKQGTYSIIEELEEEVEEEQTVNEVVEKEVVMEKDIESVGTKSEKNENNSEKNRPRSATKLEKDRQNRLCRDQKKAELLKQEDESENFEVIEEKAEVEGMETKKVEVDHKKTRKDSEGSSSQWETESEVVEEEEKKDDCLKEMEEKDEEEDVKNQKMDEKETREETRRLAAKIRSAGRRNRRKSSKGSR